MGAIVSPASGRCAQLTGRRAECEQLDQLIRSIRAGESRALAIHGEAGVGKTALLEYLAGQALGCQVTRVGGVQSELELAFAGLHQLCSPLMDRLVRLPEPQRDALGTAFGINAGPPPDRFLVGLAVLSLLSEAATERPLLCLIDDHQWLDRASAQILAFVARRLGAESVGLVFGSRVVGDDLTGIPAMTVGGLPEADARALLETALNVPIDVGVRDQIVAETRGNPLALLELPRGLTPTELAGGFGLPGAVPLAGSIEANFLRRLSALPEEPRRLLLIAAADPSGDAALVCRAAAQLGVGADAPKLASGTDLVDFRTRIVFRHPLVRSAIYRSAPDDERRRAHRALADATDPQLDPDRRAWHRAQAAPGPDEDVAAELERSADRASARGGVAAAAAFLARAAALTVDPAHRTDRALAAAQAAIQAGAFDTASDLLTVAEAGQLSDFQQALADLVRAQLAYVTNRGNDAPLLLLKAAKRLEPTDVMLSRATYLDALSAAIFAGRLANPGGDVRSVALACGEAPPAAAPRAPDLLLDGTAAVYNRGYARALPMLQRALIDFGVDMSPEEELRLLWMATTTAFRVWDHEHFDALTVRHVQLARTTGALSELALALTTRAYMPLFAGDLTAAASLIDELQVVKDATGSNLAPYGALGLAAFRGDAAATEALVKATEEDVTPRGEGVGINFAEWARAVLNNGLGRYDVAMAAAQVGSAYDTDRGTAIWPLAELIESAVRNGMPEIANDAYRRLADMTSACGSDWALGVQNRAQALLSRDDTAQNHYRAAIAHFGRTWLRVDLARSHLLYGEWLRRQRRRTDAREQLRTAHEMLEAMGIRAFAERAGRELRATGGTTRKRAVPVVSEQLTPQEVHIARLARDGLSNPEIAVRLFISAHTVQYHLHKVFTKLGITSRSQLDRVLNEA